MVQSQTIDRSILNYLAAEQFPPYHKELVMPLDHYVTLGRSGLRVSPFCLGAITFGEDLGWGSSVAESQAILDRYVELGGNFIDTANLYTTGHSQKIIADHIRLHRNKRL